MFFRVHALLCVRSNRRPKDRTLFFERNRRITDDGVRIIAQALVDETLARCQLVLLVLDGTLRAGSHGQKQWLGCASSIVHEWRQYGYGRVPQAEATENLENQPQHPTNPLPARLMSYCEEF